MHARCRAIWRRRMNTQPAASSTVDIALSDALTAGDRVVDQTRCSEVVGQQHDPQERQVEDRAEEQPPRRVGIVARDRELEAQHHQDRAEHDRADQVIRRWPGRRPSAAC